MKNNILKSLLCKYKSLFLVIMITTVLTVFCVISAVFWDYSILSWERDYLDQYEEFILVRGLVLLGKAWLLIWLLLCWDLLSKYRLKTIIPLTAMFLLVFTVFPLKMLTKRPRPRDVITNHLQSDNEETVFHSWSFPSGDTASAFAVAAAISPFIGWFARSLTFILAGCVGIFRVVSLSHYFSDVFAGAAVGIIVAYLAHQLVASRPLLRKKFRDLLSPRIMLTAIIIIPIAAGMSDGIDDLFVFLIFYPPLIIALIMLSKINMSHLFSKAF